MCEKTKQQTAIMVIRCDLMILMIVPDDLFKISKSLIILQFLNLKKTVKKKQKWKQNKKR